MTSPDCAARTSAPMGAAMVILPLSSVQHSKTILPRTGQSNFSSACGGAACRGAGTASATSVWGQAAAGAQTSGANTNKASAPSP